jgi:2-hydroxychromene-2-carboxylate isomerase
VRTTLYIDLGSPYVYLALERLERFDLGEVAIEVVSLGALFKLTGRSSWGMGARRELGMAEVSARAAAYGLPPIRWPPGWPSNYLHANRACLAADEENALERFAKTALRASFAEGIDLGDDAAMLDVARRAGLDAERIRARIEAPEIKERLRAQTLDAHASGVTGVPTLALGGRLFWGEDQLEIAAEAAR